MVARTKRLTPRIAPLRPHLYADEFSAAQQTQIAQLSKLVESLERRFCGAMKRVNAQEAFIKTLQAEGSAARKRPRFLENAAKLEVSEAR